MRQSKQPCVLAVLVSGNGSNLQAIIDQIESCKLNARIACVISNTPDAFALTRANKHNIPVLIHEVSNFSNRKEYDSELAEILRGYNVDLIVLAGYMRILSDVMINAFPNKIINIHPALLPSFPGLHAQQQALDYGVKITGCTVHFVDSGTDTGPIILQAVVPVENSDNEKDLSARIQLEEHRILPEAIRLFAGGRLRVVGRLVKIQS